MKLIIFVSVNVFGAFGWWLGEQFGLMTAFVVGSVGSILGVYAGWRLGRRLLS